MGPRISPDGKTLAFQALVNGLTQVAVMKPDSGNWTVLTRDRRRGYVQEISWSPDGAKLYFGRARSGPSGVFSVPVLGGEERLMLEDASSPTALPDGSLLVVRINSERQWQIHRFWPQTGRLQALPATVGQSDYDSWIRAFPDGKEGVYIGTPIEGAAPEGRSELYALDLDSGRSRRLAPGLPLPISANHPIAVGVTPDGRSVLANVPSGNLHRIVSVPRSGGAWTELPLSLTQEPWSLSMAADGGLYLDQMYRSREVLRLPVSGSRPERITLGAGAPFAAVLEYPGGGLLLSVTLAGRNRIAVAKPGEEPAPLIESGEEEGLSFTKVGESQVAILLGPDGRREIAIASLSDGRIVRRLKEPVGDMDSLAASPDGKNLYYVSGKTVWSVATEGGAPKKIGPGDSVAVDAKARELIVKLHERDRYRLMQTPLDGGAGREIPLQGDALLTNNHFSPAAVGPDGRILVQVILPDSWFFQCAVVDPKSGRMTRIPLEFSGDIASPGWTRDGRVLAAGIEYHSTIWRFAKR
ncbi:MAG: PD40 domain-containing protein [Acidobacteria bacterium]|nr:PD40 domain-containing protein [Acidobacteriota bacterium]